MTQRSLSVAIAALILACDTATTSPNGTYRPTPVPPGAVTAIALVVSPFEAVIPLGRSRAHVATKVMSDGSRIAVRANWTSLAPDIVSIDANGTATGVGVGRVAIQAIADGLSNFSTVTVTRPTNTGSSDALIVEDFSMIELQNPQALGSWAYAPQIRGRAAPGRAVTLLSVSFTIPGLGQIPDWNCYAALPTQSSEFNGEVYGDWALTIGGSSRALGSDATASIIFLDDTGVVAKTTVRGRIVAGNLPSTYTGGNLGGACYGGYRPPGA